MKIDLKKSLLLTTMAVLSLWSELLSAQSAKPASGKHDIVINLQKKGAPISPSMYGVFFEEINHSGDGGLYAELVQNRSFEDAEMPEGFSMKGNTLVPPPVKNHLTGKVNQIPDYKLKYNNDPVQGWALQCSSPSAAGMKLTKDRPRFATAPNNLEITVNDASQKVSLINEGFWGMGIQAGGKYRLRTIIRVSPDYKGSISACLLAADGKVLDSKPIVITKRNEWNDVRSVLSSTLTDPKAKLALVLDAPGKIWFDYVSLFPEDTFKGRVNGARKDIAQKIADLKPAFMRWPGGTIVGGITLSTRFDWKASLGDPAARPGQAITWGYRCSYGLGYYDMLQFCEDIGANFMFVCNLGLGDQHRMGDASPDSLVNFYINDCLNAIEYAIGGANTTWGARRVADGHPAAFPLKYVEIGNEQGGKEYDRRFVLFYNAIKKRYPQLSIINNKSAPGKVNAETVKTDFFDPHYYGSANSFYSRAGLFDSLARGNYKVYVGEYACNSGVESGNMSAALSEAAFISGMERNSDLVTMASYAPLLQNVNDRKWPVNLILFNSDKVIGRSSYYVQKMASENRPTYNVWNNFSPSLAEAMAISTGNANARKSEIVPRQYINSGYDATTNELVLKFVNSSEKAYAATIQLQGVNEVQKQGKVIQLAAASDKEENSIDNPQKIYPATTQFNGFARQFNYDFAPFSYTVLRIKAEQ